MKLFSLMPRAASAILKGILYGMYIGSLCAALSQAPAFAIPPPIQAIDQDKILISKEPVPPTIEADAVGENYPQWTGKLVRTLRIEGLTRTREKKVRWMLGAQEGEHFDSAAWRNGIERLYSTGVMYEIHTEASPSPMEGEPGLDLVVHIKDKWTLFPYITMQSGGGSLNIDAGIFDTNLFGNLTEVSFDVSSLNNNYSYDANILQKWIRGSDYYFGFDLSKTTLPAGLVTKEGGGAESYTWIRKQEQIRLGRRFGEQAQLETFLEHYKDALREVTDTSRNNIFPISQYRIRPVLILDRVSQAEYLEQGQEFKIATTAANFFDKNSEYHSAVVSWKRVVFVPDTTNLAAFVSLGVMNTAPVAYQFNLGGFDSIRGFSANRAYGLMFARGNFEYRTTIWSPNSLLFGLGRSVWQGCLFSDVGAMGQLAVPDGYGTKRQAGNLLLHSVGLGIRATILQFAGAVFRMDLARAVTPNEGWGLSIGVGQFF